MITLLRRFLLLIQLEQLISMINDDKNSTATRLIFNLTSYKKLTKIFSVQKGGRNETN